MYLVFFSNLLPSGEVIHHVEVFIILNTCLLCLSQITSCNQNLSTPRTHACV